MRKIYTAITILLFSASAFAEMNTEFISAVAEQATPTEITTFTIDGVDGTIDADAATVLVVLEAGTDVTTLVPSFTLSEGAGAYIGQVTETTMQESGSSVVDFTSPVVYTIENDGAMSDWTVTVEIADAIAVNTLNEVSMYPNPVNNVLTIANMEDVVEITVSDITGKTLFVQAVNEVETTISTSELRTGIYLVTLRDANNNIRTERVIKK